MTEDTPDPALVAAYNDGQAAFADGAESTTCPHPAGSDERTVWVRGYVTARAAAGVRAPRLPKED